MPSTSKVRVRLWFTENFDFYVGALGLCPLAGLEIVKTCCLVICLNKLINNQLITILSRQIFCM